MSITSAFLVFLSLSSLSQGAPVAYDDGSWSPEKYDGKGNTVLDPTPVVAIPSPTPDVVIATAAPEPTLPGQGFAEEETSSSDVATATTTAKESKPTSDDTKDGGVPKNGGNTGGASAYKLFKGDGTPDAGWPTIDQWISFEQMFEQNKPLMSVSCAPAAENNSDEENEAMKSAILSEAKSTGVDARFILATIMQESTGCVRVHTTVSPDGVQNPGLMQDHEGTASCFGKAAPCPDETIQLMISEGTTGTSAGDGLKGTLAQATGKGAKDATAVYVAARIYNSGSYPGGDLAAAAATPCYATDIANRLSGFAFSASPCKLGLAGTL